MKEDKMLSLDRDVVDYLRKESNASGLVNGILLKHFESREVNSMSEEELALEIKVAELELETKERIKELRNGPR